MKQAYIDKRFRSASLKLITIMNDIINQYQAAGDTLTVRQLYYQMVARDHIENSQKSYKNLGELIGDARMAGLMDWDAIEDRHRAFERRNRWDNPADFLDDAADWFHKDLWTGQPHRVFVVIEKAALVGVLSNMCYEYDVPLLAAKGYPSLSIMREFVLRDLVRTVRNGQSPIILHLGDHDPSGMNMTEDLQKKMEVFGAGYSAQMEIRRIALNMQQIEEEAPPPNPAKETDSRFAGYQAEFGDESWELDALSPQYLRNLVEETLEEIIDHDIKEAVEEETEAARSRLEDNAAQFREREEDGQS